MKKRNILRRILAVVLVLTMATGLTAQAKGDASSTSLKEAQKEKAALEKQLKAAKELINDLKDSKGDVEDKVQELNNELVDISSKITSLENQLADKSTEIADAEAELAQAEADKQKQYDDMKLRIQYMYENGGTSALTTLLSSKDLSEFLNNAENVAKISQYDRNMLEKRENLQNTIKDQETTAKEEKASIDELLAERASKQQEVQELAASTSDNISSYVSQISASQEEAAALTAEINNADNSIARLVQQAEEEKAAREAAQAQAEAEAAAAQEQSEEENSDSEDYEEDSYDTEESGDTYSEEESSEDTVSEDSYSEDSDSSYEESTDSSEDTSDSSASDDSQSSSESADSSQGKYLGNFTLTAYCNCAQCCGTAGNLTASGTVPTAGRTVAMAGVPFGTQLLINGNVYTVEDLGTPYGHVDIFFNNHSDALSFGLQSAEVYQLN